MITNFSHVEDWVKDNSLTHWIFYSSNPRTKGDNDRSNDKIVDSDFFGDQTIQEKLDLTKKYLVAFGKRAFGTGWRKGGTTGGLEIEVDLSNYAQQQPTPNMIQGVGFSSAPLDEEKIVERVRKEVRAEYEQAEYERKRKELDTERKEFERDKAGAIGLMVGYLKPLLPALSGQRNVAGLDAPADVEAARIIPKDTPAEEEVFTPEESDALFSLMERFKKVEPDYIRLLESVITMAEAGDSTYTMAKGFLLK